MLGDSDLAPVVFIADTERSFAVQAFGAIAALPGELPPWALIGGVAVAINLRGFHRPTSDLDAVSLDGDAAVTLLLAKAATRSPNGVKLNGTTAVVSFDIIDVSDGPPDHASAYMAHRYALETASTLVVEVRDRSSRRLSATPVRVATPAALIAMKAHSVEGRSTMQPEKRVGDLYDMVRLVANFGSGVIARDLISSAHGVLRGRVAENLRDRVADNIEKLFVIDATRSLRELRNDGRGLAATIDRADLAIVAELVTHLRGA